MNFIYPRYLIQFTLACFFCLTSMFAQDTTLVKEFPSELLFKKKTQNNFSISPNGKYFLEIIKNNIKNDIVIIDIDAYKLLHRITVEESSIQNIYWLNDKRLVYESLGAIYSIDIDRTNKTELVNRVRDRLISDYNSYYKNIQINKILTILPEEKNEILIETYNYKGFATVSRVNVFTGEKFIVEDGSKHKMNNWFVDKHGKPIVGSKYKADGWEYYVKDESNTIWKPLQIKINNKFYPLKIKAGSFLNQNLTLEGLGFDENKIYITSNIDIDKRILLSYDYKKNVVLDTLVSDINCDVTNSESSDLHLLFDDKNKTLGGIRYEGVQPKFIGFSSDYIDVYKNITSKYSQFVNDIIDVDSSNNRFIIHQWSDTYGGNIGVYDQTDNSYSIMLFLNEELNKYRLSKTRLLPIPNRNGNEIFSYLNLPINYSNKSSVPLVVIPHGGPWARDYWRLDEFAQYFSSRGYAVLRVNYSGSIGFGKKHLIAGVHGIHNVMIDDIIDATRFIKSSYKIDESKVYIFGHSYGGYATYFSLIRYPSLFKAGVALSAPTDIRSWMKLQKKDRNTFSHEYWESALGTKNKSFFDEISPINHVSRIKAPILVFHGKHDNIVPIEQMEEMKKVFVKENKKGTFRTLEFQGHSIRNSNSIGYILDQAHEFFLNSAK